MSLNKNTLIEVSSIIGVPNWRDLDIVKMPYRTTNQVWRVEDFILKKYSSEEPYLVETNIYKLADSFTFRTPCFLGSFINNTGYWSIIEFIKGTLLTDWLRENKSNYGKSEIVSSVLNAILEFESKIGVNLFPSVKRYDVLSTLEPLLNIVDDYLPNNRFTSDLRYGLMKADRLLSHQIHKQCFDSYFGNFVLPDVYEGYSGNIYKFDFDKANRCVPIGEQLSHLLSEESFESFSEFIVNEYSRMSKVSGDIIRKVLSICIFVRDLASLRDALRWLPDTRTVVSKNNVIERLNHASYWYKKSVRLLNGFCKNSGCTISSESMGETFHKLIAKLRLVYDL